MRQRRTKMDLLRFDLTGVYLPDFGLDGEQLRAITPQLESIRNQLSREAPDRLSGDREQSQSQQTRPGGFLALPDRLLSEYTHDRQDSELGRIFKTANRLHQLVDRVVVIGSGEALVGARLLMESCCQPHFNELSRGDRGSKPRMYCEANNLDNDSLQGLLHLLGAHLNRVARVENDRWCLVVISKDADAFETEVAMRPFLSALARSLGHESELLRQLFIAVTGERGRLRTISDSLGVQDTFSIPSEVHEGFSVLSSAGLLPAALVGINVVELLEGAAVMNRHFREAAPDGNIVLQFVAANYLMEVVRGANVRMLSIWSQALESIGLWYGQLLTGCLGHSSARATPLACLLPRDWNSRLQQNLQGKRDTMVNQIVVEKCRFDPLAIAFESTDADRGNATTDRNVPEILRMTSTHCDEALRRHGRPATCLQLPIVDEYHLGQLLQMLMIATAVEARLRDTTTDGRTAVEAIKDTIGRQLGNTS